jgi:hypothetical protein
MFCNHKRSVEQRPEHLNMQNAGFIKRLAAPHKPLTGINTFGRALRVQQQLPVAAPGGRVQQHAHHLAAA